MMGTIEMGRTRTDSLIESMLILAEGAAKRYAGDPRLTPEWDAADRLSEQQQVIDELVDSLTQIIYITDRNNVIWDKAKIALSHAKDAE